MKCLKILAFEHLKHKPFFQNLSIWEVRNPLNMRFEFVYVCLGIGLHSVHFKNIAQRIWKFEHVSSLHLFGATYCIFFLLQSPIAVLTTILHLQ